MDQIGATGKMVGAKQNLVCSFYKLAIGQLCYSPAQDVVPLAPHIYRLFHIKGQRRMRVERIWCYLPPVRCTCLLILLVPGFTNIPCSCYSLCTCSYLLCLMRHFSKHR